MRASVPKWNPTLRLAAYTIFWDFQFVYNWLFHISKLRRFIVLYFEISQSRQISYALIRTVRMSHAPTITRTTSYMHMSPYLTKLFSCTHVHNIDVYENSPLGLSMRELFCFSLSSTLVQTYTVGNGYAGQNKENVRWTRERGEREHNKCAPGCYLAGTTHAKADSLLDVSVLVYNKNARSCGCMHLVNIYTDGQQWKTTQQSSLGCSLRERFTCWMFMHYPPRKHNFLGSTKDLNKSHFSGIQN